MKHDIPFKIKLIGFLHVLFGIILLINGIYLLIMVDNLDDNDYSEGQLFDIKRITISLFATISMIAFFFVIIGWRLWRAKRWARYFTVILPVTYFLLDLHQFPPYGISKIGIIMIIIYSMIPSYLFFNSGAKKAFDKSRKSKEFFDF
jgi:hypothetical protein